MAGDYVVQVQEFEAKTKAEHNTKHDETKADLRYAINYK